MKRIIQLLTAACLAFFCQWVFAVPSVTGVTTISSNNNEITTVQRLVILLRRNQFIVRRMIDHQKIAKALGHYIPANIEIMAGHPSFEYPLIKAHPLAALFVPLTFVVWQDDSKKQVHISYWDPAKNITPLLHLKNTDEIRLVQNMTDLLSKLTQLAAKKDKIQ